MMREVLEDNVGIKVNGEVISSLRYADDTALLACSEGDLQKVFDRLDKAGNSFGLRINTTKTKIMVLSKQKVIPTADITVGSTTLEQVNTFTYLGSLMSSDGRCEKEIRKRIVLAKQAFLNIKELMRSDVSLGLKKRMLQCYVWPVLLYGSESWSVSKTMLQRIEAFETWCYRQKAT